MLTNTGCRAVWGAGRAGSAGDTSSSSRRRWWSLPSSLSSKVSIATAACQTKLVTRRSSCGCIRWAGSSANGVMLSVRVLIAGMSGVSKTRTERISIRRCDLAVPRFRTNSGCGLVPNTLCPHKSQPPPHWPSLVANTNWAQPATHDSHGNRNEPSPQSVFASSRNSSSIFSFRMRK